MGNNSVYRKNWNVEAKWLRDQAAEVRKIYTECDDAELVEVLMRLENRFLVRADNITAPVKYPNGS